MRIIITRKQSGLLLAALFAALITAGCPESGTITIPGPSGSIQQPPQVPVLFGGIPVVGADTTSAQNTTPALNPLTQVLALGRIISSVNIGSCTPVGALIVPDVTQITLAQAQSSLILQGLQPGTIRWAYSATVPGGNVISQDPAAGENIAPGGTINLLVSLGPQLAAIPDVAGLSEADALAAISGAGFTPGEITQSYNPDIPAGVVISQDPEGGTLAEPNAPVNLVVSQGPQPVSVPDVVGKTQDEAQAAIATSGLSLGTVVQGSSETIPAGVVMSQNPPGGTLIIPGAAVDLVVSQGPEPVAVPSIIGRTQTDAVATIRGAGFSVGTVTQAWSATVPTGSVVSQDPAAGTVLLPGTTINFAISKGPQPVPVPDVTGKTKADAQAGITAAGFTLGAVTEEYSDKVPEGSVVRQNPAGGALMVPGSAISLVIATKNLYLCDYYPFAVGNMWATSGTNGKNGTSSEISEAFIVNGFQCWKVTMIDHGANDATTYSYVASANGWMYQFQTLDDLFLLPGIAPKAQKIAPIVFRPGESFVTQYGGTTLNVTPVRGKLSDFVADTSLCPLGDMQDTVALKLGNFVIIVFGRNAGPLYFNYLTSSGFYTTITIVGGCGTAQ